MAHPHQVLGLTQTADVTDLIPEDVYSARVIEALYAARQLAGIISAVREDLTASAGSVVQVPFMSPRTAQGPIAEGVALSATDHVTGTYPITLAKYGDYDLVPTEVFEDQTIFSEADFIANMAEGLAEKVDALVYAALIGAAAGSTVNLAAAGNLSDLYDKIVDVRAEMRKAKVKPSHVIMGPDQEAQLLKDTDEGIKFESINVQAGQVLAVAGMEVIVTPLANANAATAGMVQAVVIDARRAIGEAWGRRPDTTIDAVSKAESDQVKLVTWIRYGTAALDLEAIGHVRNAP